MTHMDKHDPFKRSKVKSTVDFKMVSSVQSVILFVWIHHITHVGYLWGKHNPFGFQGQNVKSQCTRDNEITSYKVLSFSLSVTISHMWTTHGNI
jgi:hypothetical protein